MKRILFALIVLFTFQSCEKTEPEIDPTIISWVNGTNDAYSVKLNGIYQGTVNANLYWDQEVGPQSYQYKITQLSGWVLYPTIYEGYVSVPEGQKIVISWP